MISQTLLQEYSNLMTWLHIIPKWRQYDHMFLCMRYYYSDMLQELYKLRDYNEEYISNIVHIDSTIEKLSYETRKSCNEIELRAGGKLKYSFHLYKNTDLEDI